MNIELVEFTRRALAAGRGRNEIAQVLQGAGWSEPDVKAAIDSFADVTFPVPVPRPRPYLSAREVFVYLILFAALYAAAASVGALIFELIDRSFPDPLSRVSVQVSNGSIRWDISWIIVAFPLFIFMFWSVTRATLGDPTKRASRPRKWLTYLTLFVAGAFLVGDAATLVYNALGGELTIRFILKIATIAVIAGGVFAFFLSEMHKDENSLKVQSATLFAVLCTIVAAAAIIVGWLFVGSPSEVRAHRFDATRAANLATISSAITNYRQTHESLPQTLDELQRSAPNLSLSFKDPAGHAYEYTAKDSFAYELCTAFDRAADLTAESAPPYSMFEKHGLGRQCFNLEARPPSQR